MEFESDDDALAWMRAVRDEFRRRYEAEAIESMEQSLIEASPTSWGAPMPGHCHPYYEPHRGFITNWLNDFTEHATYALNIPKTPRIRLELFDATEPITDLAKQMTTLQRRTCWAPAPYVGQPFIYAWAVGIDEYGRAVAGDLTDRVLLPDT